MPLPTRIILTGFMGSGKSTIGRSLAARLGYTFVDLDSLIEQRSGRSVPEIFAAEGESAFRAREHEALAHALTGQQIVLALGGGAVETPENEALLHSTPNTITVLLAAPFSVLYDRCAQQALEPTATARPNLITRAHAQARFTQREPLYATLATHTIQTESLPPKEVVNALLRHLNQS